MEKQVDNTTSEIVVDSSTLMEKPRHHKMKDHKKQEAGRLGSAARKAKEKKRLLEELTIVRETA